VRVLGEVTDKQLSNLINGVKLDDGPAAFTNIIDKDNKSANHWFNVTLKEGRNREVKRLWESQGVTVSRLKRIRFGPCKLPRGVKPGAWWYLSKAEQTRLLRAAGMKTETHHRSGRSRPDTVKKKRDKKVRRDR
jgi:23S rRNA pseudouridine2605 synthase